MGVVSKLIMAEGSIYNIICWKVGRHVIKFGTDGWRAIISDDFTYQNVRVVAQAIADYVLDTVGTQALIVVGYDTRFLSDKYAQECAQVLAANNIHVLLAAGVTPTPALSYAIKARQAVGGIMITASHNPYQYNGIKYKASYGGSALPSIIAEIELRLHREPPKIVGLTEAVESKRIEFCDFKEDYFRQLRNMVDLQKIVESGQRIVIDPMHGAGAGYIKELLSSAGMQVIEIRGDKDPCFGGVNPEPINQNLQALVDRVMVEKATAGFATDGDADRVGAVDNTGRFVNSHVIYALLLRYLISERKWTGGVVKTFSTSQMIDKLARKYSIAVYETPIGFKYICELFLKEDILLGGEESGGIGFKNHIPERDGILASLLLMEIMAAYKMPLHEIIDQMMQEIGYHYYDRLDLHIEPAVKDEVMESLRNRPPNLMAGKKVNEIQTLDGIKFMLEGESWLLFRASGTEPVVRIYAEAETSDTVARLLAAGRRLFES